MTCKLLIVCVTVISNIIKRQRFSDLSSVFVDISVACHTVTEFNNLPLGRNTGLREWCCENESNEWVGSHFPPTVLYILSKLLKCSDNKKLISFIGLFEGHNLTFLRENKVLTSRTDLCLRSCYCSLVSGNVGHISSFYPKMKAKKCNLAATQPVQAPYA